jgi:hypothetical protein
MRKTVSLTWPWKSVRFQPGGCWEWTGGRSSGYGRIGGEYVHRAVYKALVGPIPEGMTVDHLCRNRVCVNPAHMEIVSRAENVLRGEGVTAVNARKTHCPRGHPLVGDNLKKGELTRKCRLCHNARQRVYEARIRAE